MTTTVPTAGDEERLVERLREASRDIRNDGTPSQVGLTDEECEQVAALITRLRQERDEARGIVREVHWMAVRYADGRRSYAPGMCNDALRKAYDAGWLSYKRSSDHDLDPQYAREGDKPEYRSIEARARDAEAALTASNAEAERLRADIAQATDLMRKAHAVMRACGWQLAISAEPAGDGILEEACTEIEADFGEFLAARALQGSAKQ